jgi:hypothetical protein
MHLHQFQQQPFHRKEKVQNLQQPQQEQEFQKIIPFIVLFLNHKMIFVFLPKVVDFVLVPHQQMLLLLLMQKQLSLLLLPIVQNEIRNRIIITILMLKIKLLHRNGLVI